MIIILDVLSFYNKNVQKPIRFCCQVLSEERLLLTFPMLYTITETDTVCRIFCLKKLKVMDNVQNNNHILLSEIFRFNSFVYKLYTVTLCLMSTSEYIS
jgi:hypothetical protein